jgi:peptidoglycan/LPS O-acetylase OafA/YrhL
MNYLTSLRGIAAFLVLLYHLKLFLNQHELTNTFSFLYNKAYLAVDFFFILSGFILSLSYFEKFSKSITSQNIFQFIVKRIARIWPLHIFILCCFVSIPTVLYLTGRSIDNSQFSTISFLTKTFLVDLWFVGHDYWKSWNTPSWTISGEFLAYLLFPFIARVFTNSFKIILLIYVLLLCAIAFAYEFCGLVSLGEGITSLGLLRCILSFAIGICIFCIYKHLKAKVTNKVGLFITIFSFTSFMLLAYHFNSNHFFVPLLFSMAILGLVLSKSSFHDWLSNPKLVYFGEISYSLYLNHVFVITWYIMLFLPDAGYASLFDISIIIIISVLSAHFTYQWVEKPMRKKLNDRFI